jgi:CheY-like chemotaxis protein
MDGLVATETIRAFEGHDEPVPIIALTADALIDTRERCLAAGMQEVLTKPLGMPELKALLIRHFGSAAGLTWEVDLGAGVPQAAPLVDRAMLARLFELLPRTETAALYANLFAQGREASARMHRALRSADASELQHASHGVKGAALNLGLRALADAADHINQRASALNATELALALQRFDETLAATRDLCVSESLVDPA